MTKKRNTLNNIIMNNQRDTPLYKTLVTDLAIQGILTKAVAEKLLGYEIPSYLHAPDGKTIATDNKAETKVEKKYIPAKVSSKL